jgi:hypothetical protein
MGNCVDGATSLSVGDTATFLREVNEEGIAELLMVGDISEWVGSDGVGTDAVAVSLND